MAHYDYSRLQRSGTDLYISANVEIRTPQFVSVGSHSAIDSGFYCTTRAEIGDYVHIAPYVTVIGGANGLLRMGHFTNLAAGCRVICGSDAYLGDGLIGPASVPPPYRDSITHSPVVLENFANVGTNVVLMPGVTLAEGTVIGACSLVTRSTAPWTIYFGVPARPIKARPREKMLRYAREMGY